MMSLLSSRKFLLLIVSLLGMVLTKATGIEFDESQLEVAAGLVASFLVAQGLADLGAGGSTRELGK